MDWILECRDLARERERMEEDDPTELELGIRVYRSNCAGFSAVLKARYSDFLVHEGTFAWFISVRCFCLSSSSLSLSLAVVRCRRSVFHLCSSHSLTTVPCRAVPSQSPVRTPSLASCPHLRCCFVSCLSLSLSLSLACCVLLQQVQWVWMERSLVWIRWILHSYL